MKQIDRLVIRELLGPWTFGVGLFTSLLMAGTYLGRLTGFLSDHAPLALVGQLVVLYLPALMVKTFAMSMLLAGLLGFGRMSSDSEIVALRASGASVYRIIFPVVGAAILISLVTFAFNESVVPYATSRSLEVVKKIATATNAATGNPISRVEVQENKVRYGIVARNLNPTDRSLDGVAITYFDEKGDVQAFITASKLSFLGSELDLNFQKDPEWELHDANIISMDGSTVRVPGRLWPQQLPKLNESYRELTSERKDDFDAQSFNELRRSIETHRTKQDWTPDNILNAEYGLWNKVSVPLAAVVFGALGAVLGIQNHRTGTASGFALAVAIIFGYITLGTFMNTWAMKGVIPPAMASFGPLVIGLIASGVIMWRRNG